MITNNGINCKMIKELIQNNDHIGAYILGCQFLGLNELVEKLEVIDEKHNELGYLSSELSAERREIYEEMMNTAKWFLGGKDTAEFKEFYMSF